MGVDFMSTSVLATVRSPEPDPDREHCVRISFNGSYHYESGSTRLDTSHRGYMLVYSQYPIHLDTNSDGNIIINTFEPSTYRTRVEFDMEFNVNGTDYGNLDFEYHNIDIERDVNGASEMWIRFYPDSRRVTFHNCHALNELPIVAVPDYDSSFHLYCYRSYIQSSSRYGEFSSIEQPLRLLWYVGSNSKTMGFTIGNINSGNSHCTYTAYNFNNPLFTSGQAWLDYCKEQV